MEKKNSEGIRINKYISDYGFCSRREADKLIEDQRVTINNRLATAGDRVCDNDNVRIDGEHLAYVPREARPKKHRWGPPRNADENNEEQATRRSGQRGAVRNSRNTSTSKPRTTTANNKRSKPESKKQSSNNRGKK
jgi:23S rRNA pseudouridine2604 synthase